MREGTDKEGNAYTECTFEEATHVIFKSPDVVSFYRDICITILDKPEPNRVRISNLHLGVISPGNSFEYTPYTSDEPIYCMLGTPEPVTVEDIKKHLKLT